MKIYSIETIRDFSEFYTVVEAQNKDGWTLIDVLPSTDHEEGFILLFAKEDYPLDIAS
ncbi:hypothetical protein [Anaerosolibacter carboniphilus]|nr:hypothetical protein [Anaerosolibacter carboniphilus]